MGCCSSTPRLMAGVFSLHCIHEPNGIPSNEFRLIGSVDYAACLIIASDVIRNLFLVSISKNNRLLIIQSVRHRHIV